MDDFKLDIEVKVTVKPVSPKTGTTQRGPYERNLFVVQQSLKKHYVGAKTDVAAMVVDALAVLGVQQPLGTLPPEVLSVQAETPVSSTAFTTNAVCHDHNQSTTVTCEYGTTPALGSSQAATQSPISGDSAQAVTCALTGLTAETKYYYRIKVSAGGEDRYSELKAYTTPAA
jgi:hypothetical protein